MWGESMNEQILVTFPGKLGDILWALPTIRAISETVGAPVDFVCEDNPGAVPPASRLPELLMAQPYIGTAWAQEGWTQGPPANQVTHFSREQRVPISRGWPNPKSYDKIIHLGYCGWPQRPLAQETNDLARIDLELPPLRMDPWILPPANTSAWAFTASNFSVVVGFTDEHAELKAGLIWALAAAEVETLVLVPPGGSRICNEWLARQPHGPVVAAHYKGDLREAARIIANCSLFVGCLSSQAVLAAAMGRPRVLVEPSPARHNPIFQHWDTQLVVGHDGLPTVDARAVVAAVKAKLDSLEARDGH